MLEKGKLYRVNDYAMSEKCRFCETNHLITQDHGWLWMWDGEKYGRFYELRSLATGTTTEFLEEELEAADA